MLVSFLIKNVFKIFITIFFITKNETVCRRINKNSKDKMRAPVYPIPAFLYL